MKWSCGAATAVVALAFAGTAGAAVNSVTPSTNEINTTNNWAHVVQLSKGAGTTGLQFVSATPASGKTAWLSCFEYRTDGDTGQRLDENGGNNYNVLVTDGLYPYICVSQNPVWGVPSIATLTVHAKQYVEVRLVFGGNKNERFDWTRFDVLPNCTPTGLWRDGIDLTAAVIDPIAPVTGVVDATDCNIGVYYDRYSTGGSVDGADVYGANYYGVVNSGATGDVDVTNSSIHDIGENPLNGTQHGIGVLYTTIDQAGKPTGSSATGTLSGSTITNYQKGGVVVSGSAAVVTVQNNTVTGQGPIDYIAQNGIQISYGGSALVTGNTVSGNWYTPSSYVACGLLFYVADGVKQQANNLAGNQRPLCNAGRGGGNESSG